MSFCSLYLTPPLFLCLSCVIPLSLPLSWHQFFSTSLSPFFSLALVPSLFPYLFYAITLSLLLNFLFDVVPSTTPLSLSGQYSICSSHLIPLSSSLTHHSILSSQSSLYLSTSFTPSLYPLIPLSTSLTPSLYLHSSHSSFSNSLWGSVFLYISYIMPLSLSPSCYPPPPPPWPHTDKKKSLICSPNVTVCCPLSVPLGHALTDKTGGEVIDWLLWRRGEHTSTPAQGGYI